MVFQIAHLSAMEVNVVRPFVVRALQAFYKHDNPVLMVDLDSVSDRQSHVTRQRQLPNNAQKVRAHTFFFLHSQSHFISHRFYQLTVCCRYKNNEIYPLKRHLVIWPILLFYSNLWSDGSWSQSSNLLPSELKNDWFQSTGIEGTAWNIFQWILSLIKCLAHCNCHNTVSLRDVIFIVFFNITNKHSSTKNVKDSNG